jgi:glycosyltransferase involved in cell wall biosynthesis
LEQIKSKKKVLFVVGNYVQAGAQRYQYEVIKALNKEKYEIDIYTPYPLGTLKHKGFEKEYYYPLLKNIVREIIFPANLSSLKKIFQFISRILYRIHIKYGLNFIRLISIPSFFDTYDIINITDYNYKEIKAEVKVSKELFIHVMTAKMQTFPNSPYSGFDFNSTYNFVVDWAANTAAFEFSEFKNGYNITRLPLVLDTSLITPIAYQPDNKPYKIGIFTRVDYKKPLDPFFMALHLLIHRGINVHLHLFGAGDPSVFNRLIKMFSLENVFFFEGHQEDLGECLQKYNLNLAWFQANNYTPGGYAAYETMLKTLPNVFWDFQPLEKERTQGTTPYPFFWEVEKLVDYTAFLLEHAHIAQELGELQRKYVIEHHEVKTFIHRLEYAFDNL